MHIHTYMCVCAGGQASVLVLKDIVLLAVVAIDDVSFYTCIDALKIQFTD